MTRARLRSLLTLGSRAAAMAVTILLTVVVTRQFGPGADGVAAAGAFFYAFTALYLVATVTRWGAETLALRQAVADPRLARAWAPSATALLLLLSLPGALLLAWLIHRQPTLAVDPRGWWAAGAFATAVVPVGLVALAGSWLRAVGSIVVGSYLELAGIATAAIVGLVGVRLAGDQTLPSALLTFAGCAWLAALVTFGLGLARLGAAAREAAAGPVDGAHAAGRGHGLVEYVRQYARPMFSVMLTALGFFCFAYLATLAFGAFGREHDTALFNTSRTLANFVPMLATLQVSFLGPQFAALQQADDLVGLNRVHWRATAMATGFGLLVAMPLLLAPGWLLQLVGKDPAYAAGAPILRVLAVAFLLVTALGQVYPLLMTREGVEHRAGMLTVVSLLVAVVAMVAVQALGAAWIAGASMLAPLTFAVLGHVLLGRRGVRTGVWQRPTAASS